MCAKRSHGWSVKKPLSNISAAASAPPYPRHPSSGICLTVIMRSRKNLRPPAATVQEVFENAAR